MHNLLRPGLRENRYQQKMARVLIAEKIAQSKINSGSETVNHHCK